MRALWILATVGAGCSFTPASGPSDAPIMIDAMSDAAIDAEIDAKPANFHLHVEAHIDGRSNLIFKGTTVQWHHYQYAAPGREQFVNYPTKLAATDWLPVWPDIPDAENRDCDCTSSVYSTLPSAVPRTVATATVTPITTRKPPSVIQQPTAANDYTLVVELNDINVSGASWNVVDIDVVVP